MLQRWRVPTYPILTERLSIRPYTLDDLDALAALHGRTDTTRYLYWEPRTREDVRELLGRRTPPPPMDEDGQVLQLAAELRGSGQLVGDLYLFVTSREHEQAEIGFLFHPDVHRQGLATEGGQVLLRLGFENLGAHRVCGRCDGRNAASAALMRRLGMRQEAHLVENELVKGEWTDELVFAVLGTEWAGR